MNPLARLDLSRFRIDAESFVGQAIELGVRFDKLPPQTAEALLGFLRAKGMYYGKRNRTGIAIARAGLEFGVRQALICLDMGLEDLAEGDLNRAVVLLALGDFESFRKRGYELAFFQLLDMQKSSVSLLSRPEAEFLQTEYRQLKRWSLSVPETWTRPPDELEEGGEQLVDPRKDFPAFLQARAHMDFLRSIPGKALNTLQQVVDEGRSFDGLLRNLILALALDLETLLPTSGHIASFQRCFANGKLLPEIRTKVMHLMERQLESSVEDVRFRHEILQAVEEEILFFEQVAHEDLAGFFLLPGKKTATADDLLGEAQVQRS